MKTRRTIKGTSAEGVVEEAYTPSNPPPYPVVDDGSYLTLGAGYLATQIKITANSSALVGWNKFAEISYGTASTNYSYSAILLVNGVHSTQLSTNNNTSESGEIEIDFYKEAASNPTQIGISVLSGNINANEICAVLDSANSKISLYSYFNLYQSVSYSLISEEQGLSSKPAKVVFVSEYYGTTAPTGAIYAVVRNNASYAATAETLTEPFTVGKDTTTATTGYVKFASVSLPSAYRSANARFEVLDKNPVNAQTNMCGVEVIVKNINATNVDVVPRLLYGSSNWLNRIYACVKTGAYPVIVDLYYKITSDNPQETIACIKPLFTFTRVTGSTTFTFITDNEPVSALPTDTTNTQLSTVYELVTEAKTAAKATQDANGNVIDTTYATKTEVNAKYTKPASGIPETDLSADVQAKLNSGGSAENLLKSDVTMTYPQGTNDGSFLSLGYALGIEIGKQYSIELTHNDEPLTVTGKVIDFQTVKALVAEESTAEMSIPIKISDTDSLGFGCQSGVNLSGEAADDTVFILTTDNVTTTVAHTVVFKSITEYTEVVADKVKKPLKITVNGEEKTYDGSEAVEVDINTEGANNLIQTTQSTTTSEVMGISSNIANLNFALNLKIGSQYIIKYKHENIIYEATAEAWNNDGITVIGSFDSGSGHIPIDIIPGDENSGIIFIADKVNLVTQQSGEVSSLTMFYPNGTTPSVPDEFISLAEIEPTIETYKIQSVSISQGETMSSVVTKITSAIAQELTAQGKTSAIVSVIFDNLMIADEVIGDNTAGRVFLETSYMSATSRVSANKMIFSTPLVRAVGDGTSSVWGSGIWAVSVQFGKFNSNIAISTGGGGIGGSGASFKDLSNFVSDKDTTIDIILY